MKFRKLHHVHIRICFSLVLTKDDVVDMGESKMSGQHNLGHSPTAIPNCHIVLARETLSFRSFYDSDQLILLGLYSS
jgi:hypothetical protein